MTSAILVNYFGFPIIRRALDSIMNDPETTDIVVVDNSCDRKESENLTELARRYTGLRLVLNKNNTGFAKACNLAYSMTEGEYVLLLNPDAYLIPPAITTMKRFLQETPDAAAVSPMVYWDDTLMFCFPHYTNPSPAMEFSFRLSELIPLWGNIYSSINRWRNLQLWNAEKPLRTRMLHGGVMMFKRSAADLSGGLFDERFFLFYEDTDFCLRLRKAGFNLYILPGAKAVHNYTHLHRKIEVMKESHRLFFEKHYSGSLLLRFSQILKRKPPAKRYIDYGRWERPPFFHTPEDYREAFLFEWSPNPLFIPSIGCFGTGGIFRFPEQIWNLLGEGIYYGRFSPAKRLTLSFNRFFWEKA